MIGTQFETDTVLEGNYPVNEDGSVIFDIDNMKFSTAFYATITKAEDNADTETKYTAPYIGYYEAEDYAPFYSDNAPNLAYRETKYIPRDFGGADSYISNDWIAVMNKNGSELTYNVTVPSDGRYELNFIYGTGQGTNRNNPDNSLSLNLYQNLTIDGGEPTKFTMNNTLLTNTTGAKRVFVDLRAGTHSIKLTSLQDAELWHDLLVVKHKGEYGKELVFDKIYEGEEADFNTLLINKKTTVSTNAVDNGYSGSGYITGLTKSVTEGGGVRWTPVVRESGLYAVTLRYKSANDTKANIYVGNTAMTLNRKVTDISLAASEDWSNASAVIYLEKGINIVDIDADSDIKLDYMRITATSDTSKSRSYEAEELISGDNADLFTVVDSPDAGGGKYVKGMLGGDVIVSEDNGFKIVTAKTEVITETLRRVTATGEGDKALGVTNAGATEVIKLKTDITNNTSSEKSVKLGTIMTNNEYSVHSNSDKDYTEDELILDSAESDVIKIAAGETKTVELELDPKTLKKPDDYTEKLPVNDDGSPRYYPGDPARISSDKLFHRIFMNLTDSDGNPIISNSDVTWASAVSAKDTEGQYLELKYNAETEGDYALQIFHSNDELCGEHPYNTKIIDRYINVAVSDSDGKEISDKTYFFINSYSRDTFKEKTVTLHLKKGENTIRMYNNDSVSRWYGGDVAIPSQRRQVNYAPNLDKFIITPMTTDNTALTLNVTAEKDSSGRTVTAEIVNDATDNVKAKLYAASYENDVLKSVVCKDVEVQSQNSKTETMSFANGDVKVFLWDDTMKPMLSSVTAVDGKTATAKSVSTDIPDTLLDLTGTITESKEYKDNYIENAGFGTGDTDSWNSENVTVAMSSGSYDGNYAVLTKDSTLSQTAKTSSLWGDGFLSVYTKGTDIDGKAYLVLNDGDKEIRKELALGNGYEATAIKYSFVGKEIEVSIDTSELANGTIYADNFRITTKPNSSRRVDSSIEYYVDCGDHRPEDLPDLSNKSIYPEGTRGSSSFGVRNSLSDRVYGLDEVTGYKWGVVTTEDDPVYNGDEIIGNTGSIADSEGAWTKWQRITGWPTDGLNLMDIRQTSQADFTQRDTLQQSTANGYPEGKKQYIRYKFELDPGTYEITLGQSARWWSGGPYDLKVNDKVVDTYTIKDNWAENGDDVYAEHNQPLLSLRVQTVLT